MTAYDIFNETLQKIKDPMLRKVFANSCYPVVGTFKFFSPELSERITNEGNSAIKLLIAEVK